MATTHDGSGGAAAAGIIAGGNSTAGGAGEAETSDLRASLIINFSTICIGISLWSALSCYGLAAGRPDEKRRLPTAVVNYLTFLEECRHMFLVQMVLSAVATIPYWGLAPISVGVSGRAINTAENLTSTGLAVLCLDTALRGIVALLFVEKLRRRIHMPKMRSSESDEIQRTLWLTGLPVFDQATGEPFLLEEDDFARVANDLREALVEDLKKEFLGIVRTAEIKVSVAPVVDRWHEVSLQLQGAKERKEAYFALLNDPRSGCCGWVAMRHYLRQHRRSTEEAQRLERDLQRIATERKRISGAAFVTFGGPKHRDYFLRERPHCWQCRHFAYFTFGRPPFASVTLACTRAPHPTDVHWLNLHITPRMQRVKGGVLIVCLFVAMVTIVTPVTITSQMNVILPALRHRIELVATELHAKELILGHTVESWYSVTNQAPALILVVINSLVLPDCIRRIGEAMRLYRKSSVEIIQMHLNYCFLLLNALVIPVLGLTSIGALIEWCESKVLEKRMGVPIFKIFTRVLEKLMQSSGVFAVRYIFNCACLSNVNSLLQVAQITYRAYARRAARTARELVEAEETWEFAWGYWYAWTISIFTMGLVLSTVVPSTLPCAALFFTMQHFVDKHNLARGVYSWGAESENVFITRALHYMRCSVAAWWLLMGCSFSFILHHGLHAKWDSGFPLRIVRSLAGLLPISAVLLVLWSWYDQQMILHDSHFESVDISKRGMHRRGLCRFLDRFLRNPWCSGEYAHVGADAQDEVTRMSSMELPSMDFTLGQAVELGGASTMLLDEPSFVPAAEVDGVPSAYAKAGGSMSWDARHAVMDASKPL